MRVTNFMVHNQSLNGLHRNMRHLSRMYEQAASQRVISRPSEDPLVASRSLRFGTRIDQIGQHRQNVDSGLAWMSTTETALFNLVRGEESIFGQIRDELTRALNEPNVLDDRLVILNNLLNLSRQIGHEMNQNTDGRFVFSGWRANQPAILMRDQPGVSHTITQSFDIRDIERTYAFQRLGANDPFLDPPPVSILKLPFRETGNGARDTQLTFGGTGSSAVTDIPGMPPFGVFDRNGDPFAVMIDDPANPGSQISVNVEITQRRSDSPDAFVPGPGPSEIFYIADTGELVLGSAVAEQFTDGVSFRYQVSNLQADDLNPLVYFDTWSTIPRVDVSVPGPGVPDRNMNHHWPISPRQTIYYEFNLGTSTHINSLAHEVFTATMFADLRRLIDFGNALIPPNRQEIENFFRNRPEDLGGPLEGVDLLNAVNAQIAEEEAAMRAAFTSRFENMLAAMDRHSSTTIREHTNIGTRMNRVGAFESRLEEDQVNFIRLRSENEDLDMFAHAPRLNAAEFALHGALRVMANNVQLSLVNFV